MNRKEGRKEERKIERYPPLNYINVVLKRHTIRSVDSIRIYIKIAITDTQ